MEDRRYNIQLTYGELQLILDCLHRSIGISKDRLDSVSAPSSNGFEEFIEYEKDFLNSAVVLGRKLTKKVFFPDSD